jgi:membrane protein implicated in regulation of membrane protease activity
MILGYLVFLVLGVIAFFFMPSLSSPMRISVALAIFLIPSIALTIWVVKIGDRAPSDAITILPNKSNTDLK